MCCRGQLGKQVTEQLLAEHVRDLAAYDAKALIDMFGVSTGELQIVVWLPHSCTLLATVAQQLLQQALLLRPLHVHSMLVNHAVIQQARCWAVLLCCTFKC